MAGYYAVGAEAHLDLSDLADAEAVRTLEDELVIWLGDDVVRHIVEQTAFDDSEGPMFVNIGRDDYCAWVDGGFIGLPPVDKTISVCGASARDGY